MTNDEPVPVPGKRDPGRALVPRVGAVRRGGSTAAALAQVATGRADAL